MRLTAISFEEISGWSMAEAEGAWAAFQASCKAILENLAPLRAGIPADEALRVVCRRATSVEADRTTREEFFRSHFTPHRVYFDEGRDKGFVTGYYQPEIQGSLVKCRAFAAPVLSRPADLIDMRGVNTPGWDTLYEGARRRADGGLEPYPDRAAIERRGAAAAPPVVWLEDYVEVFYAQVQGSARIVLADGARLRLVYDGRNGRPYSSIGRILTEMKEIAPDEMSMARCKEWLRANGLEIGQRGRDVLQRNQSYVFFRVEPDDDIEAGPIGAAGIPLTPLRSLAVDRNIWPYGLPVWINADLSDAGLREGPAGRLMIAQDTGSAIVGPARGDLYIGSGASAGDIAGRIRHKADFIVFLPKTF